MDSVMPDFSRQLAPLKQRLIVSCQAPADSPLHDPGVIAAMALASLNRGAVGVRLDTPTHVAAVRSLLNQHYPDALIIGLWKQTIPGFSVYITPQFHHAQAIAEAGADIIALDCTQRPRPGGETLDTLIPQIRETLGKPVMADVDTLESAIAAVNAGADLLGTTLYGYTEATANYHPPGLDLLSKITKHLPVPGLCEGGISTPDLAKAALTWGAYGVVVGTAITGIDQQVQTYCRVMG